MVQSLGDCSGIMIYLVFPYIYGKIRTLSENPTKDC